MNEPVLSVPPSTMEETDTSAYDFSEQYAFNDLGLSTIFPYSDQLCARDRETPANGAACHWEPQCEGGKLAMCCTKFTVYGRPTECTRCVYFLDDSCPKTLTICHLQMTLSHSNAPRAMVNMFIVVMQDLW